MKLDRQRLVSVLPSFVSNVTTTKPLIKLTLVISHIDIYMETIIAIIPYTSELARIASFFPKNQGSWGCISPFQGCAQCTGRRGLAGCFAFQPELAAIRTPMCFLLMLVGDWLLSFRLVKTGVTNLVSGELAAHWKAEERTTRRKAVIT